MDIAWARDRVVVVEAANGLKDPGWSSVGTYTLTGGSAHVTDRQGIGQPNRFYRVVSP